MVAESAWPAEEALLEVSAWAQLEPVCGAVGGGQAPRQHTGGAGGKWD